MGKRGNVSYQCDSPPEKLTKYTFYGLDMDEEQEAYRDAIWDKDVRFVSVNAAAGSGKTMIAVATASLLHDYGLIDQCIYIRTPSSEGRIGFLPGDKSSKERPYMQPLYNALANIGVDPYKVVSDMNLGEQDKYDTKYWFPMTDVYLLGDDFSRKAIVIDEAQCMTTEQLKTIITRCHDDCKVILIGSTLQIQGIDKNKSGFNRCIEHFETQPWARHCQLSKNYRGEMSAHADLL